MFLKTTTGDRIPTHRIRRISAPNAEPPEVGICDVLLDDGEEERAFADDVATLAAAGTVPASPGWRVSTIPQARLMHPDWLARLATLDDATLVKDVLWPSPVVAWRIVDGRALPLTPFDALDGDVVVLPPPETGVFAIQPGDTQHSDAAELAAALRARLGIPGRS